VDGRVCSLGAAGLGPAIHIFLCGRSLRPNVTGRSGPPYASELGRIIYVVTDVVMDVVNEVRDAAGDYDGP
jgi:hypothetical protein